MASNNQISRNDHSRQDPNSQRHNTTIDLYPVALRAIEEDDLNKMKTLIELESFTKDSIDILLEKACERSHDISIEEEFVKNSANITNIDEEQSMLSVCQTNRKNNEQLVNLLLQAETHADLVENSSNACKKQSPLSTPTKPMLKSVEKAQKSMITPETPEFKTTARRELKFS